MDPISETELMHALKNSPRNKAPGPSGIPVELWKNANHKVIEALRNLLNKCLLSSDIPTDWKKSTIILIPKPKCWKGDINITRPITLIETARKLLTRILTDRISHKYDQHKILKGNNISVLKNTNTMVPIHTLNNILEHSREYNKEVWITFQDMKKAYDSVGWQALNKALNRIKMNEAFILLLSNIHNNRHGSILTEYGPTPEYKIEDGIDQGETYSPIL